MILPKPPSIRDHLPWISCATWPQTQKGRRPPSLLPEVELIVRIRKSTLYLISMLRLFYLPRSPTLYQRGYRSHTTVLYLQTQSLSPSILRLVNHRPLNGPQLGGVGKRIILSDPIKIREEFARRERDLKR